MITLAVIAGLVSAVVEVLIKSRFGIFYWVFFIIFIFSSYFFLYFFFFFIFLFLFFFFLLLLLFLFLTLLLILLIPLRNPLTPLHPPLQLPFHGGTVVWHVGAVVDLAVCLLLLHHHLHHRLWRRCSRWVCVKEEVCGCEGGGACA